MADEGIAEITLDSDPFHVRKINIVSFSSFHKIDDNEKGRVRTHTEKYG